LLPSFLQKKFLLLGPPTSFLSIPLSIYSQREREWRCLVLSWCRAGWSEAALHRRPLPLHGMILFFFWRGDSACGCGWCPWGDKSGEWLRGCVAGERNVFFPCLCMWRGRRSTVPFKTIMFRASFFFWYIIYYYYYYYYLYFLFSCVGAQKWVTTIIMNGPCPKTSQPLIASSIIFYGKSNIAITLFQRTWPLSLGEQCFVFQRVVVFVN
jgi:hypothetical protein